MNNLNSSTILNKTKEANLISECERYSNNALYKRVGKTVLRKSLFEIIEDNGGFWNVILQGRKSNKQNYSKEDSENHFDFYSTEDQFIDEIVELARIFKDNFKNYASNIENLRFLTLNQDIVNAIIKYDIDYIREKIMSSRKILVKELLKDWNFKISFDLIDRNDIVGIIQTYSNIANYIYENYFIDPTKINKTVKVETKVDREAVIAKYIDSMCGMIAEVVLKNRDEVLDHAIKYMPMLSFAKMAPDSVLKEQLSSKNFGYAKIKEKYPRHMNKLAQDFGEKQMKDVEYVVKTEIYDKNNVDAVKAMVDAYFANKDKAVINILNVISELRPVKEAEIVSAEENSSEVTTEESNKDEIIGGLYNSFIGFCKSKNKGLYRCKNIIERVMQDCLGSTENYKSLNAEKTDEFFKIFEKVDFTTFKNIYENDMEEALDYSVALADKSTEPTDIIANICKDVVYEESSILRSVSKFDRSIFTSAKKESKAGNKKASKESKVESVEEKKEDDLMDMYQNFKSELNERIILEENSAKDKENEIYFDIPNPEYFEATMLKNVADGKFVSKLLTPEKAKEIYENLISEEIRNSIN